MIEKVHIHALKSIKDLEVDCSNLNLFVGTNSSGKSTFMQAILLMAQEKLNGKLVSLGDFREVRNYNIPDRKIKIELWGDKKKAPDWIEFIEETETDTETYKVNMPEKGLKAEFFDQERYESPRENRGLHYLSCHRIGVRDIYDKNMFDGGDFGINGEYSLAYLLKNEDKPIDKDLEVSDEKITNSLLEQVNYWLNDILGTTLSINDIKKTNYLQVKYSNNPDMDMTADTLYNRPMNVGAGVSYLISIIIMCLGSKKDEIIIIENPEIHLHPKAQSKLSKFLYFISKNGRQLFIETHSDHIFNGLRVGISTGEMRQDDITINFFALNEKKETNCNPVKIEEYGKIIGTNQEMDLNDLFDQFDIDLDRMLGL